MGDWTLSEQESSVGRQLALRFPGLVHMYDGAIFASRHADENPEAHVHAAHSLRELMEKLARSAGATPHRPQDNALIRELERAWKIFRDADSDSPERNNALASLLARVEEFFEQRAQSPDRRSRSTSALVALKVLSSAPVPLVSRTQADEWTELEKFFIEASHHRSTSAEQVDERKSQLERFLLNAWLPTTFEDFDELDRLLKSGPVSPEVSDRTVALLRRSEANADYFFNRLVDPAWLIPLHERGLFRLPPPPLHVGGGVQLPFWVESAALVRLASAAPTEVSRVIQALPETANDRVHGDVMRASLWLAVADARQIANREAAWIASQPRLFGSETDAVALVHRLLAESTKGHEARRLAAAVFSVEPSDPATRYRAHFEPRVDRWQYGELLHALVQPMISAGPREAVGFFADLLGQVLAVADGVERPSDRSYIWRPAIEDHEQNQGFDLRDDLVVATRDAASAAAHSGVPIQAVIDSFRARDWEVFHRLALHLAAETRSRDASPLRRLLLDRSLLQCAGVSHEYLIALRRELPRFTAAELGRWIRLLREGPDWVRDPSLDMNEVERQAASERWRLRLLSVVGAPALPHKLAADLASLETAHGRIEHPDFLSFHTSWIGPESPLGADEILAEPIEDLVEFLQHWQPASEAEPAPSPEGLERALAVAVEQKPATYAAAAPRFEDLSPSYINGLLRGLERAARDGEEFAWAPVMDLIAGVLPRAERSTTADVSTTFRDVRLTAAALIRAGLQKGRFEPGDERTVWATLEILTTDPDPTPEHEERFGGVNMSPIGLSLNTVRGQAVHALADYVAWLRRATGTSFRIDQRPRLEAVLDGRLDPANEPSVSVRAALSDNIPTWAWADPAWLRQRLPTLFPAADPALRNVAWSTFVNNVQPQLPLFEMLRSEYALAVERLDPRDSADLPKLGEHLGAAYIWGALDAEPDSMLSEFFERAPDSAVAHVLWFLSTAVGQSSDEVEPTYAERLDLLWHTAGSRLLQAERPTALKDFGWWFGSRHAPPRANLDRLERFLRAGVPVDPAYKIFPRLAELAPAHAEPSLRCLELLTLDAPKWSLFRHVQEIRAVLMSAGSPDEQALTIELIHRLGAQGLHQLRDLLPEDE